MSVNRKKSLNATPGCLRPYSRIRPNHATSIGNKPAEISLM